MAETQGKRIDDSTPENAKNTGSGSSSSSSSGGNQTNTGTQNSQQANTGDINNSSNKNNTGGSGGASNGGTINTKEIIQQAKETAGQAYGKVTEQASTQITAQKDNLAHGLASVADNIRHFGENLRGEKQDTPITALTAKYGDSLASQVEQVSNYLEKNDLGDLIEDVGVFARRNPAIFIGGAFALGIALARFLKSSNPKSEALMRRPHRQRKGVYIPDESEGVYLPEDLSRKVGLTDNTSKNSNAGSTATGSASDKTQQTSNKTSADDFSANRGG